MIENGTLLQNRYLIEAQIGKGGMGAVYRAVDRRFDSYVAIKETFYKDNELGDAFEREAKLLNGLNHPNLPHVSDYFSEGGGHFLVMQFVEGEDLHEILKRDGAFPLADVLRWTNSLLDALDYLHSQNPPVIHRDIKPQNLKITTRGDIVLLDFGLAKLNSDDTQGAQSVFGYSRKYSPLEQIQGTGTDARSDIFALGATIYHLLTGKPPIDVLARAAAIVAGNDDPLELANAVNNEIPDAISNILKTSLALNSAARFVSAKAMRQAFENAVNTDLPTTKELPAENNVIVPPENGVVNSVETENFPALEAFAAETANAKTSAEIYEPNLVETPISFTENSLPLTEVVPQKVQLAEEATKVIPKSNQSRLVIAALIALLSCLGLAASYLMTKANSSSDANQPVSSESAPEPDSNNQPLINDSASTEAENSVAPPTEKTEQIKNPRGKTEATVEKRETVAKRDNDEVEPQQIEITEKSKPAAEKPQPSRPVAKQNVRRSQSSEEDEETRSRVVEVPVPDIESIFTGRPSTGNNEKMRRQNERRQRDQMTDEELREYRRRRRAERRRRIENDFPF